MKGVLAGFMIGFAIIAVGCDQGAGQSQPDTRQTEIDDRQDTTAENQDVTTPVDQNTSTTDDKSETTDENGPRTAVFAGGCFWCTEAVFEQLDGVSNVVSGYAGDSQDNANYRLVSMGVTRHAEAIEITYDPKKVSYEQLLEVHFATHDPTQLNRQGNDVGPQYRSAIFYMNEKEKEAAEKMIEKLNGSGKYSSKIVTTLEPHTGFFRAEEYHQDYAKRNPFDGYIRNIAAPKVEKTKEKFPDLLKEQ